MKWNGVPALAGCFAVALTVSAAGGQTAPGSSSPAQTPPTSTAPGTGQDPAATSGAQTTAGAQNNGGAMAGDQSSSGGSDKKFVKEAMQGSMAEIQLGQLAQQKASSPDVKQFGQQMVTDHQKLSDQMSPIASQMGITPPTDLDMKHKAIQKKLQGMSGEEFDKAYMRAMVKDHQKDLSEFQKEASSGKNPQVKDAAQQGAQVIQQHLQLAQDVSQKVGGGGGNMGHNKSTTTSSGSTGTGSSTTPQATSPQ